ncbi:hypothetical protein [Streptomyces laurentii]|uniref:hypothetical protein n=1 Tax=Streptomyces laurentii TaxID=39478 RepID=UPI0036943ABD
MTGTVATATYFHLSPVVQRCEEAISVAKAYQVIGAMVTAGATAQAFSHGPDGQALTTPDGESLRVVTLSGTGGVIAVVTLVRKGW